MSKLLAPQWLHCSPRTNTFYVMILNSEDGKKNFQAVRWISRCKPSDAAYSNYRKNKISGVEGRRLQKVSSPGHLEHLF